MQFSIVALLSTVAVVTAQTTTSIVSVTEQSTTTATIDKCGAEVTDCPYANKTQPTYNTTVVYNSTSNVTSPAVSTFEGAGNKAVYAQAGAAVVAGLAAFLL